MQFEKGRFKLRQARFFLTEFDRESSTTIETQPERARYMLSAFVASAQSVFEWANVDDPRFCQFKQKWRRQQTQEDQELIAFMIDERNKELHKGGARLFTAKTLDIHRYFRSAIYRPQPAPSARIATLEDRLRLAKQSFNEMYPGLVQDDLIFKELRPEIAHTAVRACYRYMVLLESLVEACERALSERDAGDA